MLSLIILFSLLPALIYSFIIYVTMPYKTVNLVVGFKYLLGGLLSIVILIMFFEIMPFWYDLSNILTNSNLYPMHYAHLRNFVQIGLIEETSKLMVFFIIEKLRRGTHSDHPISTMFYVGMISLGFSVIENISYALNSIDPIDTIMWRSITAVIGHMVFGLFMGYWISLGRLRPRLKNRSIADVTILRNHKTKNWLFVIIGLLSATILHGVYDLHLNINGLQGISSLYMLLIMSLLGVLWCFNHLYKVHKKRQLVKNI